jgi:hypothetical protein
MAGLPDLFSGRVPAETDFQPERQSVDAFFCDWHDTRPFRFRDRDHDRPCVKVDVVEFHAEQFAAAESCRPQKFDDCTVADVAGVGAFDGCQELVEVVDGDRGRCRVLLFSWCFDFVGRIGVDEFTGQHPFVQGSEAAVGPASCVRRVFGAVDDERFDGERVGVSERPFDCLLEEFDLSQVMVDGLSSAAFGDGPPATVKGE